MAVVVVTLPMLLATFSAFFSQKEQIDRSLTRELNSSLSSCLLYYHGLQERLEMSTRATAYDNTIKTTLRLGVLPQLQKQILSLTQEHQLDFLLVTDLKGQVVAISPTTDNSDSDFSQHPLILKALQGKPTTTVFQEQSPLLVQTTQANGEAKQDQTFFLESATPIKIRETLIGTVLAGIKLSGNNAMMQAMQEATGTDRTALITDSFVIAASFDPVSRTHSPLLEAYNKSKATKGTELQTTMICQHDQKKNIFKSADIADQNNLPVIKLITILDYDRAGILIKNAVLRIIIVFLAGMVLAATITFYVARSIAAPVNALSQAMENMEAGIPGQTPIPVTRKDEIGSLVEGFNRMSMRLNQQLEDLKKEIEERTRTEKLLADEKERLAVTLRSIGDAVITTDTAGIVVFLNKVAENLTGWSNSDAQGQASDIVFHLINEKTGTPCRGPVQRVMESGRIVELDNHTALVTKDGTIRSIADSGAPIHDRNNQIVGVVIVFRDITHELKMKDELLKIKKLESIGVLAGGIAHDFNNILSAILGNIELAAYRMAAKDTRAANLLTEAKKAVLRAESLTKQLLTFSKGGDPVKDSTSLPELIRDSADFVLHGSHVSCEYHFPDDLWMADADSGQLSQVIQNIILNAKYAMPEGGRVIITASNIDNPGADPMVMTHKGPFIKITIKDTGVGIPPEIMDKIFDPYFTTKTHGSGLGLAICHSIISKHNGNLTVQSDPKQGTTFTIYLPAAPGTTAPKKLPQKSSETTTKAARIMVLDDEKMIRDIVHLQLLMLGYEVELVDDGADAIKRYKELREAGTPVDLVIMDLTIPAGMGGKEAAQILLEQYPDARLIVASGYSNDPVMANYRQYGFRAAVSKPFDMDDLQQAIAQALHG